MADSLVIKIDGDDSGLKKTLSSIGNIAKKGLGVAVKGIAATSAALAGLSTMAVKGYAEYEQLIGGVDTLFEKSSKNVQKNAANAYKTAGMSANEYMKTATSFAASLKQSFADTEEGIAKAADVADMAVKDISDNANKMGTAMQSIQDAYQGFAKQNYTMLDNLKLGYGGTKTEMERLLADATKLSGIKYDISNLADVYNAIHVIQTELGITGTTAKEAATTIEGSASMMKASWENLVVGFADDNADLDVLLDNFTDSVLTFGKNIIPRIKTTLQGVGKFVNKSAEKLIPEIVKVIIDTIPDLISAATKLAKAFGNALISNFDTIISSLLSIITELIDGINEAIPALRPVGKIVLTLVNNLKALTAATIASVTAFKTMTVLRSTISLYTAAKTVVTAYTAAVTANTAAQTSGATINALLVSTMKPLEILVGVLTGKIQLQTAATVALAAAKKLLTGNIGLLVAGLAAAAAAIGAFLGSQAEYKISTDEVIKQAQKRQETLTEEAKAYKELKQAQIEQASADLAQVAQTQVLYDELRNLVAANGEVNESNRARVNFILGELNNAYGTEYKLIDGVIQGYQNMQTEIDNLIEKKKWEIVQKAALPAYEEAVNNQIANRIQLEKDLAAVEEQKGKVLQAENELKAAQVELDEKRETAAQTVISALEAEVACAEANYNRESQALETLEATYQTSFGKIQQAQQDKLDYQRAATLASQGLYNDAIGVLSIYTSEFHNKMQQAAGDIQEQRKVSENEFSLAQGAIQSYLNNVANGVEEFDESTLRQLINYAQEVAGKAQEVGANIGDGMITGLDGKKIGLIGCGEEFANNLINSTKTAIESNSFEIEGAAEKVGNSGADAVSSTTPLWNKAAGNAVSGVLKKLQSPEAKASIWLAGYNLGRAGVDGYNAGQDAHSPAKDYEKASKNSIDGLIIGFEKNSPKFIQTTRKFAEKINVSVQKAMSEVNEEISRANMERLLKQATTEEQMEKIIKDSNIDILDAEKEYLKKSILLKDSEIEADKERLEILQKNAETEKKIYDAMAEHIEDRKNDYIDRLEEIKDAQEDFADNLQTDLFEKGKVKNNFGNEIERDVLNDWSDDIAGLETYKRSLDSVSERLRNIFGSDTEGFNEMLNNIRSDPFGDGGTLLALMNEADDNKLSEYVRGWQEYQNLADTIAVESFSDEAQEIKEEFEKEFGILPEDFFAWGDESGTKFGEGFMLKFNAMIADAKQMIQTAMSSMIPTAVLAGAGVSNMNTTNNYSSTINIQANGNDSAVAIARAQKNYEDYKKMSGGSW